MSVSGGSSTPSSPLEPAAPANPPSPPLSVAPPNLQPASPPPLDKEKEGETKTTPSTAATTPSTTSPSTTSSPGPAGLVPGQPLTASASDKRTLFVSGFPADVKPREVHNFFRFLPGFVSAVLSAKRAPVAFVTFERASDAAAAQTLLVGQHFDLDSSVTLRLEYAKTATHAPGANGTSPNPASGAVAAAASASAAAAVAVAAAGAAAAAAASANKKRAFNSNKQQSGVSTPPPPSVVADANTRYPSVDFTATQQLVDAQKLVYMQAAVNAAAVNAMAITANANANPNPNTTTVAATTTVNTKQNKHAPPAPPCATLFVASLPPNCTEQALTKMFAAVPGFKRCKMSPKTTGAAVAFAEFTDLNSSALAMATFNDFRLSPTDKHGLRLEYARASMGAPAKRPPAMTALNAMNAATVMQLAAAHHHHQQQQQQHQHHQHQQLHHAHHHQQQAIAISPEETLAAYAMQQSPLSLPPQFDPSSILYAAPLPIYSYGAPIQYRTQ